MRGQDKQAWWRLGSLGHKVQLVGTRGAMHVRQGIHLELNDGEPLQAMYPYGLYNRDISNVPP